MSLQARFEALVHIAERFVFCWCIFPGQLLETLLEIQTSFGNNPKCSAIDDVKLMMDRSLSYGPLGELDILCIPLAQCYTFQIVA